MPDFGEYNPAVTPYEINVYSAYEVMWAAHHACSEIYSLTDHDAFEAFPHGSLKNTRVIKEISSLIREIGERATPEVLAQHLIIKGLRTTPDLPQAEILALKTYAFVLLELDKFAAAELIRMAPTPEEPERPPVPIEDTILETSGSIFDPV